MTMNSFAEMVNNYPTPRPPSLEGKGENLDICVCELKTTHKHKYVVENNQSFDSVQKAQFIKEKPADSKCFTNKMRLPCTFLDKNSNGKPGDIIRVFPAFLHEML